MTQAPLLSPDVAMTVVHEAASSACCVETRAHCLDSSASKPPAEPTAAVLQLQLVVHVHVAKTASHVTATM